jgi:hypothetical protein
MRLSSSLDARHLGEAELVHRLWGHRVVVSLRRRYA